MKETTYRKVTIFVTDNGYSLVFGDHQGKFSGKQDWKVAKDLKEVAVLLKSNLTDLVDNLKSN